MRLPLDSPLSLPLAYCRGLPLSMLLKLWLRRLRLDEPGLLEAPLPAAGTREGPGNLMEADKHSFSVLGRGGDCLFLNSRTANIFVSGLYITIYVAIHENLAIYATIRKSLHSFVAVL